MTELEYVITHFEEKFQDFQGKRILIHGSRNYAESIIKNFQGRFHFVGVISYDQIEGSTFLELPVFQETDLPELRPDMILLTERVKYAEAAYRSLRRICREHEIAIYNMYGLDEMWLHREAEKRNPTDLQGWRELCQPYDRVVFEVMDTLIRKSLLEEDAYVREVFGQLIPQMRKEGKRVAFSLRKSFPEEQQIEMLRSFGLLTGEEGELIRRREEDLSFRIYRETYPKDHILYIGSGLVNEFILPRCYGIDSCRFRGAGDSSCMAPALEKPERIPYLADQKERIQAEIEKHDLISFDIYDTLLQRKTLYPADVFALTEANMKKAGYAAEDFSLVRRQIENELPFGDIDQIYNELGDYYRWDLETTEKMKQMELDVEREVLLPRTELVDLFNFAVRAGKNVVLTSDMYMPERILRNLLEEKGIRGFQRLFVSCDCKKSKESGLYEELLRICGNPEHILHIGDNRLADGKACERHGIQSVIIPSALELAAARGWNSSIRTAGNLMERGLLGMVIAKLFRDPFQNPNLFERPVKDRMTRYGVSVVGTLVTGYLTWMIRKTRERDFDGILFLARDGYLPMKIYQQIQENLQLPRPIYYYTNRHSAFLCCADEEARIGEMAELGGQAGLDGAEILKNIYSLQDEDIMPPMPEDTVPDYIDRHMPVIHRIAEDSREAYRRYSCQCEMRPGQSFAIFDFVASGTTQLCLQKFLPYKLTGYYFSNYTTSCRENCEIEYYFDKSQLKMMGSFIEVETYLSSPEPSLDRLTKSGEMVFARETRSEQEKQELLMVLDAAEEFGKDYFRLFYAEDEEISSALIDEIYGAEGCHFVQHEAYDDWIKVKIERRTRGGASDDDSK